MKLQNREQTIRDTESTYSGIFWYDNRSQTVRQNCFLRPNFGFSLEEQKFLTKKFLLNQTLRPNIWANFISNIYKILLSMITNKMPK